MVGVNWFQAGAYCRWLSERAGVHEEQMCYPELAKIRAGMALEDGYLKRTGFRLPTEAEWEYVCRSGMATARAFGGMEDFLAKYGWYALNARRARSVGLLKPNEFGFFALYGNASEWTMTQAQEYRVPAPGEIVVDAEDDALLQGKNALMVLRGGSYSNPAWYLRSAFRYRMLPIDTDATVGVRVTRTLE